MLIKAGVDISRLRPEIRKKLNMISAIMLTRGQGELVITSTFEGTHCAASLHYANLAVDIRRPNKGNGVYIPIKLKLGPDYDVILHSHHIHIEYDPK